MTSWGQLIKNLAGQAEEFAHAFSRSGDLMQPNITAEMTIANPFHCK